MTIAAAKATGPDEDKYTQEQKAVGDKEEIVEIHDAKEFSSNEKADNPTQHQESAENAGSPSGVFTNRIEFHKVWFR
jgi:hypothetical protein